MPTLNTYSPISVISDQSFTAELKAFWNNTGAYLEKNGVVIRNNLKTVADKELDVWMENALTCYDNGRKSWNVASAETLTANLTLPVGPLDYTGLPTAVFGSTFTIPAMTLTFTGIADGALEKLTYIVPSGFKYEYQASNRPAFADVDINAWIGSMHVVGEIGQRFTLIITPPA